MTILPITECESHLYPESDGEPLGENTLQVQWIFTIYGNLDAMYRDDQDVVVAADLFWYAVQGSPSICTAPDTMVVFGRPKGHRSSYLQWQEGNVAPQVVFEVQSPGNTEAELQRWFDFYQQHGVEEYYLWYPHVGTLEGWQRSGNQLVPIAQMQGHKSPRLGIRFDLSSGDLVIYRPDGQRFLTYAQLTALYEQAEEARQQAEDAARVARERGDRLAAQLRALGIEPEA